MFDADEFVADCRAARGDGDSHKATREVVARAVSDPAAVLAGLGEPEQAGLFTLHRSDDLTVLNIVWAPHMTLVPHNHRMWAVIGIYSGREDNIFWRRVAGAEDGRIEAAGAKSLCERDAAPLGRDIVHSVTNPIARLTAAIHVYGGDFFAPGRSEWDPETLLEHPWDIDKNRQIFDKFNDAFAAA
jgi:predicted metal-dependent enzyme (double-stranded beta helix superfamily)